jgi:hypothetical protein
MLAILEQMMAKSDAHQENTNANRKTIKELMDAIQAETKAIQARRKAI